MKEMILVYPSLRQIVRALFHGVEIDKLRATDRVCDKLAELIEARILDEQTQREVAPTLDDVCAAHRERGYRAGWNDLARALVRELRAK